jgi:hypothetical protein
MKVLKNDGIDQEQDYSKMKKFWETGVKSYKRAYEKYISVAEEYNIDLMFCDLVLNDACIDAAHTLKKPVVVLVSVLQSNYKFFFYF